MLQEHQCRCDLGAAVKFSEYLALVQPDGATINSEFNEFPQQFTDQSYGLVAGGSSTMTIVDENAAIAVLVPASAGDLDANWNEAGYVTDGSWISGNGGVGYERGSGFGPYIDIDTESLMYGSSGNASAFTRQEFTLTDASAVTEMT